MRRKRPPRARATKRPERPKPPRLHIYEILQWADAYHRRMGRWPSQASGEVAEAPWDTWARIDAALRAGTRGCRPLGSLPKFLHIHRGVPLRKLRPRGQRLTEAKILAWADEHQRRTGRWPSQNTPGPVCGDPKELWKYVDMAMRLGNRGMAGGESLARLLMRRRGVRRARYRPKLTIKQILAWADEHHARTGQWPRVDTHHKRGTGRIPGTDENWNAIHGALEGGGRGLPSGYTLATLLALHRGAKYHKNVPPYTPEQILKWADAHIRRTGTWPTLRSGAIPGAVDETWLKVEGALSKGRRGLPGGDSLSKFLVRHGRRARGHRPHHPARHSVLTIPQILAWADCFHRREGRWPAHTSGPIAGANDDDTWRSVDNALREGMRGLPGGSSIALLLEKERRARHKHHAPPFSAKRILAWADAAHRRERRWPTAYSGPVREAPGETWMAVENALRSGTRGMPGGESVVRFLKRQGRREG